MEETASLDNKFLGEEKVGKLLKMFSIPCVLSLIIQALYNLVDQIFIGNSSLGQLGNTATGIVYPLTVIALALGLFIGDGSAACISINQGRSQTKDTHKTIGTGITIGFIVSAIFVAISFIFRKEILVGFGAKESGLAQEFIDQIEDKSPAFYELYLSTEANQTAIKAQENVLKEIAKRGSCVIVGRAADYVLKDFEPFKVFIYAPLEFRQKRIMANYGDDENKAQLNIEKADKRRAKFYESVTGQTWGNMENYNLSIDSSIGIDKVVEQILLAVENKQAKH